MTTRRVYSSKELDRLLQKIADLEANKEGKQGWIRIAGGEV
jgi:hypothetical protein